MSRNFILLVALLFCNVCIYKAIAQVESNVGLLSNANDSAAQRLDGNSRAKTKFVDLNFDVLYLIIDQFELAELTIIAQSNAYHSMASDIFRLKYHDYNIQFSDIGYRDPGNYHIHVNDDGNGKCIAIVDHDFGVEILKLFGNVIKRVYIQNHSNNPLHSTNINRMVNQVGSESITHLDLSYIKRDTLQQFAKPFNDVEELHLTNSQLELTYPIIPFNRLFPNLKRAEFRLNTNLEYKFIDCNLPNLVELEMYSGHQTEFQCERLIRKNPQIRKLKVWSFANDYARTINELLPELESLTLGNFYTENGMIHFKNVKHFWSAQSRSQTIDRLSFARLESLRMNYNGNDFNVWQNFFRNHNQTVTKLHLSKSQDPIDMHMVDFLIAELPHLVKLTLINFYGIDTQIAARIFQNHPKLMRFEFARFYTDSDINSFHDRFGNEWDIQVINKLKTTYLTMDRKNSTLLP